MPTDLHAHTVDDVIDLLDGIVATARQDRSRDGFFPAMYRLVTEEVKRRCDAGEFDDNDRMRRLAVIFANRYLAAYHQWQRGDTPTQVWVVAFEAVRQPQLLILQHLMLGVNAHIGLDLGIAAVETAGGVLTPSLHADFLRINAVLESQIDTVQARIGSVSPLLNWVDMVSRLDETITAFSVEIAREAAWQFAQALAELPATEHEHAIRQRDLQVARFSRRWARPRALMRVGLHVIGLRETRDVGRALDALAGANEQTV